MANNDSFWFLNTQISQSIFTWIPVSDELQFVNIALPNKLRAYMFADKKSHSPDIAVSGVKQDMLVDFMICCRYSLRSLLQEWRLASKSRFSKVLGFDTYVIVVFTLTLFSHSNSVHMLRNYDDVKCNGTSGEKKVHTWDSLQ